MLNESVSNEGGADCVESVWTSAKFEGTVKGLCSESGCKLRES